MAVRQWQLLLLQVCMVFGCWLASAQAAPLRPFSVVNQGPLALPLNLPASGEWRLTPDKRTDVSLALDLANTYTREQTAREDLLLDGESWRTLLRIRHGFGAGVELGLELPLLGIGGGIFDGFITGWHDFFSLPQGGRDTAPKEQLRYQYQRDGVTRLDVRRSSGGLGDLCLTGGWQLLQDKNAGLTLKGMISLPTGNSADLRGSGTAAGALWLAGGMERPLAWGRFGAWGSLGGMGLGTGDLLPDQQRNIVGLATVGAGWSPAAVIDLKLQLLANTPLYGNSDLTPLAGYGLVLAIGGSLHFSPALSLDIAVSEDLNVGSAADVALQCTLAARF